jgi:hypothetical protein
MKVEKTPNFSPIVITLETLEEAQTMYDIFSAAYYSPLECSLVSRQDRFSLWRVFDCATNGTYQRKGVR